MALQLSDLQGLGLLGNQQPDPYGGYQPQTVDQLLQVQPLAYNPPAPLSAPLGAPAPVPNGAPPAAPDKLAGNPSLLEHLQTVMQHSAQNQTSAGPKGLVRAGETVKTTDDGLTPEQRASGVAVRGQADLDTAGVDADRQRQVALEAETHAAKLRAQAQVEDEQRQKLEQENEQRQERIRQHQEALAEQRDEPVNPNRYFENMSLFGKAAAVLSAFSYGFLNPRNQGVAPIMQTLTQMASEDTRAQIANNQEGRARRGDLMALYERRYGDSTLVAKKLEADKLMTLGKKALADAEESKSAQAKALSEDLGKKLLINADVKNKEVEEAYAKKPVEEITTTYKPAAGKGGADSVKKALELDALMEKQGFTREQRAAALKAAGVTPPQGSTLAEKTDAEQAAAAQEKDRLANDKIAKLSPEERKDMRTKIDGLADVTSTLDEMQKASEFGRDENGKYKPTNLFGKTTGINQIGVDSAEAIPWHLGEPFAQGMTATMSKEANDARRLRDTIAAGLAKAEFARTTEFEFHNEQKRLPLGNATDLASGMDYAEEKARVHYRNAVGQYGQEAVDRELRDRGVDPKKFQGTLMDPDELTGAIDAHAEHGIQDWQADPDFAREALFQHVGAGLLTGTGLLPSPDGPTVQRLGRNLLTEAEHATALRSARDLMAKAGAAPRAESADAVSRETGDEHGLQYLRDNADSLSSQLATKQAKAAQALLDSYGEVSRLRPDKRQLADAIPDNRTEQARWVSEADKQIRAQLEALPGSIAKPLREKLDALGEGDKPAEWFERASDLSDALTRARASAVRQARASDAVDGNAHQLALDSAQRVLSAGLGQESLWGGAATSETQRSAGYERRVGDHLGDFEELFTSRFGGQTRTDPDKFLAALTGDDATAGPARRALQATLEAARATAGTAQQYGRHDDARRILGAVDTLEGTGAQARAIQAALRGGTVDGGDPEAAALSTFGAEPGMGERALGDAGTRAGVYRAAGVFMRASDAATKQGASDLLRTHPERPQADGGGEAGVSIAAPETPTVNAVNFDAVRDHIDRMANDPRYFGEVLGASFGRLPEAAPEVFQAVSQQAAKTVNYLAAVAPGGKSGGPFAERVPVSEDELWDFNQRFAAVTDPEFVRNELRSGSLTSQAVESLQACNERSYMRLQMQVFEQLQQLSAAGIPVPSQAREQLDTLLDLDGGGDPALTWQVAERAQAAEQSHMKRLAMKGSTDASNSMTSGALASLNKGAAAVAQTG